MKIREFEYIQFEGTPRVWSLSDMTFGSVNLVVGKNAVGKSRTLNVINGLGKLVSGHLKPAELSTGTYTAIFEHQGREIRYFLKIQERKVVAEEFRDGDTVRLKRGVGGLGTIFHEKENRDLEFQTPETDAAVVARMDTVQHRFLEPLAQWGAGVRHYQFGDKMGRETIAIIVQGGPEPDPRDANAVIGLFRKGVAKFGDRFTESVKRDMSAIGYKIDQVGVMPPTDVMLQLPVGAGVEPLILFVKEQELPCLTQQTDMSQGMFRALSVIIHLNFATIANRPSCIIVDDIGEGLDFDRSCRLIELLRSRTRESDIQLLMATNDRFVMNHVPLEEWTVLQREGQAVRVRNYENSRDVFEEFKFTGLSNFDFFATDYLNEEPQEAGHR